MKFEKGDRVHVPPFDDWKFSVNATHGIVNYVSDNFVIVDLEGDWTEAKREAEEFRRKFGESPNVVSWSRSFHPSTLTLAP